MGESAHSDVIQDRDGAVTTILLADDHAVVRSGLRMLLESEPDFEVVAEVGDTDAAERSVRGHKPDILMLDLNMPGRPTLEAIPDILESSPRTSIVVLTMQDDPAFAREAMRAGALGYVLKEAADDELISAVRLAAEGKTYMHPRLGAKLAAQADDAGRQSVLTDREREVLKMIALGYTNREIADEFVLSVRTVESHRAHIQQKLDLVSRAELVRYALDNGIIDRP
ncbi:MAG: response regulator transcription factor [Actinobacteria bacterium]|nr:response regulator transcription factor [Actinomycetota bacterium]